MRTCTVWQNALFCCREQNIPETLLSWGLNVVSNYVHILDSRRVFFSWHNGSWCDTRKYPLHHNTVMRIRPAVHTSTMVSVEKYCIRTRPLEWCTKKSDSYNQKTVFRCAIVQFRCWTIPKLDNAVGDCDANVVT